MPVKSILNKSVSLSFILCCSLTSAAVYAEDDFIGLDLEDLMDVEVYSVSRSKQSILDSAAAVYVIDKHQIRNSGLQTVQEILRLAPGVQVSQISSHTWSVSMRGFGGKHENRLLVMQDGRSLYTPFFSGVYWDMQDIVLDNIERIEIVRGPGGTLWGANAVNGVINIITKKAEESTGTRVSVLTGNFDTKTISARHGAKIDDDSAYRISTKYTKHEPFDLVVGHDSDDIESKLFSFRYDTDLDDKQNISLMGKFSEGALGDVNTLITPQPPYATNEFVDIETRDYDVQLDYSKQLANDSRIHIRSYYEKLQRKESTFKLDMDIFNIDFQHSVNLDQHHIIWGLEYRYLNTTGTGNGNVHLTQGERSDYISSFFVQDDICLIDETVFLTVGSKFEEQSFTGFEVQPNIRLRWKMSEEKSAWAAVSRAVRTPSITEKHMDLRYAYFPDSNPYNTTGLASGGIIGNSEMDSEELIAYEVGFKQKLTANINYDLALFYHDYDNLRGHHGSIAPNVVMSSVPHLEYNTQFDNLLLGNVYGLELASSWKVTPDVLLKFNYSYTEVDMEQIDGSTHLSTEQLENKNHQHMGTLDLNWQLTAKFDLGSQLYYYSGFDYPSETQGVKTYQNVDDFVRWDLRMAYQVNKNLELSLIGQNLLNNKHIEYVTSGDEYNATIEPTYYFNAVLKF